MGRRLYLSDFHARNANLRQAAARTAINAPMQGTAADIIKTAMIDVHQWLREAGLDARIVMQVHDELVLEVAQEQLEAVRDGLRSEEHTSELQSRGHLVCRLLLEKK